MNKKYEFLDETIDIDNHICHRIVRIADGVRGGYIESEDNLSQDGSCWVFDEAVVYGDSRVYGDAQIKDNAIVADSKVCDHAIISDYAIVEQKSKIFGYANIGFSANIINYQQATK